MKVIAVTSNIVTITILACWGPQNILLRQQGRFLYEGEKQDVGNAITNFQINCMLVLQGHILLSFFSQKIFQFLKLNLFFPFNRFLNEYFIFFSEIFSYWSFFFNFVYNAFF